MEKIVRLFVSIGITSEIQEKLAAVANKLPQESIKPVKKENIHLTLKFIGEVDESKVVGIKKALGNVDFSPLKAKVKGVGVFPNENYVKVVWAGVECGGLEQLAKSISNELKAFEGDNRFSAHITIARVRKKIDVKEFLEQYKQEQFGELKINSFELMQSILSRQGPEYKTLASFSVNGE